MLKFIKNPPKFFRKYTSLVMFFAFLCSSVTGYFLYIGKGDIWGKIHTVSSFTIFFAIIAHLIYNFKPLANYLKDKKVLIYSFLLASFIVSFFMYGFKYLKNQKEEKLSIDQSEFGSLVSEEEIKNHIIFKRRSVREFTEELITDKEQELIIRAGLQAPTAKNQRSYEMIIVTDKTQLDYLADLSPYGKPLRNGATFAVIVMVNKSKGESIENLEIDCANVTMNMWLMATSLDLGAVWISNKRESSQEFVRKYFNLSDNFSPIAILAVGRLKNINDNYYKNRFDKTRLHFGKY